MSDCETVFYVVVEVSIASSDVSVVLQFVFVE